MYAGVNCRKNFNMDAEEVNQNNILISSFVIVSLAAVFLSIPVSIFVYSTDISDFWIVLFIVLIGLPILMILIMFISASFSNFIYNNLVNNKILFRRHSFYIFGLVSILIATYIIMETGGLLSSPFIWVYEYFAATSLYLSILAGPNNRGVWRKYRCVIINTLICGVMITGLFFAQFMGIWSQPPVKFHLGWNYVLAIYSLVTTIALYPIGELVTSERRKESS